MAQATESPGASPQGPPVNLLWTGGWDSTYRLVSLLLQHRRAVVPYYLIDTTRPSQAAERDAMERIRAKLGEDWPHTRGWLAPTEFAAVGDVPPDAEIDGAFQRIVRRQFIGNQYAWLARFCRRRGLRDLELSVQKTAHGAYVLLRDFVVPATTPWGATTYRLADAHRGADEHTVFGCFTLPLFETTKLEMARTVDARGWGPVMGLTWFCHRPAANGRPCGICNPCLYAIEQGFGWRISPRRRALSAVYRATVRPLKLTAKKLRHRLEPDVRVPGA